MYSKVQYISQGATAEAQLQNIQAVLDNGFDWIQLRFKHQPTSIIMPLAEKVKLLCDQYDAIFIMNDDIDIAKNVDASGVHLGLTDTAIADARALIGIDKIIGGTANTIEHVQQRITENCDYIGLGPFRFTTTKEKLSPVLGLDGYRSIYQKLEASGLHIPIYAIGGIEMEDIESLMEVGLHGIAVSGLLTHNPDIKPTSLFDSYKNAASI